jgi:hypothetical protein
MLFITSKALLITELKLGANRGNDEAGIQAFGEC